MQRSLTENAEDQALRAEIKSHVYSINRPYSALMSAFIFPVLLDALLLEEWSPLRGSFESLEQSYFNYFTEDIEKRAALAKSIFASLQKSFEEYTVYLRSLYLLLQRGIPQAPLSENHEAILAKIDGASDRLIDKHTIKKKLIEMYNAAVEHCAPSTAQPTMRVRYFKKNSLLDPNDANQYSIKQIFQATQGTMANHKKFMDKLFTDAPKKYVEQETTLQMNRWIKYASVAGAMVLQYVFMDRALQWKFPHGIKLQCYAPFFVNNTQDEKETLKDFELRLRKKARRNIMVARVITLAVIPAAVYLLESYEKMSPRMMIFALSMAAAGCKDLLKDGMLWYGNRQYSQQLEYAENAIKFLLTDCKYSVEPRIKSVIEACQMTVSFGHSKEYNVSPEKMARTFVGTLNFHQVGVVTSRSNKVVLAANFVQDHSMMGRGYQRVKRFLRRSGKLSTLSEISETFHSNLTRHSEISDLKKQLKKLLCAVFRGKNHVSFLQIPQIDHNGFPDIFIEFNLPASMVQFKKEFEELFSSEHVEFEPNESGLSVTLQHYVKIDEEKLQVLIKKINEQNEKARQDEIALRARIFEQKEGEAKAPATVSPAPAEEGSIKSRLKTVKAEKDNTDKKETTQHQEEKKALAELHKLFHLSEAEIKKAPLLPIASGSVRDFKTFRNTHHFVRCTLDAEEANAIVPEIYAAIEGQLKDPAFAAKKGQQGFRLWKESGIKELKGEQSSLKLKLLGDRFGDYRVMAVQKWPPPGVKIPGNRHVLHELTAVVPDAHKTLVQG